MQPSTIESSREHAADREADDAGVPWEVVTTVALPQGRELRVLRRIDAERGPLVALVRAPSQGPKPEGVELPRAVVPEVIRGLAFALDVQTPSAGRQSRGDR